MFRITRWSRSFNQEIKPFNPDKIYEIVLSVNFSINAQFAQEAQEKLYQFSKYQLQIEHPGYNLVQQLKQLPLCSFLRVVDQLTNVIPLSL